MTKIETTATTAPCPHCGCYHSITCPRIAGIEYNPDGTIKRVDLAQAGEDVRVMLHYNCLCSERLFLWRQIPYALRVRL